MNSKRFGFSMLASSIVVIVALFAWLTPQPVYALQDPNDYTFTGTHEYDAGSVLKVGGTLSIGGTKITASADTINASASGLATNQAQTAVCSNLTAYGSAVLTNGLTVYGTAAMAGATTVGTTFGVTGIATVSSNLVVGKTLTAVGGASTLTNLTVYGTVSVPAGAISAASLTAGTSITAVNAAALTNIPASNLAGSVPIAALTNALGGSTYTNATATFTNVFLNGILTSHTP